MDILIHNPHKMTICCFLRLKLASNCVPSDMNVASIFSGNSQQESEFV